MLSLLKQYAGPLLLAAAALVVCNYIYNLGYNAKAAEVTIEMERLKQKLRDATEKTNAEVASRQKEIEEITRPYIDSIDDLREQIAVEKAKPPRIVRVVVPATDGGKDTVTDVVMPPKDVLTEAPELDIAWGVFNELTKGDIK